MSEREWRFYLDDMLRFAEKVRTYSAGIDQATFERDELKYDAILRNLELIGEAATHVPGVAVARSGTARPLQVTTWRPGARPSTRTWSRSTDEST